ncbi:MAG: hypothetical protein KDB40_10990 [Acidimicrobiales bacterium]|nr:hypothetical protein [Acidimicrobiales bacterium]MCB9393804.1 hypothetical protein [Acidimicrobiaceae bacterium]
MAREELRLDLDIATKKAQANLQAAARETKRLGKDFEDTRTAGEKFASAMENAVESMRTEVTGATNAVERMTAALGPEAVAAAEKAGGSVEGLVADLRRLGFTYDEVAAEADSFAATIRNTQGELGRLDSSGARVVSSLDNVNRSGEQTRSVFANLVGNSVQDLGALGGVAGTAGVAMGQLAEYAVDGNISLSSLGKFVGPMALVGAGLFAVSQNAKASAEHIAAMEQAMENLSTVADDMVAQTTFDLIFNSLLEGGPMAAIDQLANNNLPGLKRAYDLLTESGQVSGDMQRYMAEAIYEAERAARQAEETTRRYGQSWTESSQLGIDAAEAVDRALQQNRANAEKLSRDEQDFQEEAHRRRMASITEWLDVLDKVPAEQQTEIRAALNRGDYNAVEGLLNQLIRDRVAAIYVSLNQGRTAGRGSAQGTGDKNTTTWGGSFGTPTYSGGGGGGGSSSGGGGGGSASDPMAEWDSAVANLFEIGGYSEEDYRAYLQMRLAMYEKHQDEYVRFFNEIKALDDAKARALQDQVDAEKKAADEKIKILEDEQRERERIANEQAALLERQKNREFAFWLEEQGLKASDMIRRGEVTDAFYDNLKARGWTEREDDGIDAIWRPSTSDTSTSSTSTTVVNNYFPPGVAPSQVAAATVDFRRRGGR